MELEEIIYVVDDDARVREGLAALLRSNGHRVASFQSGQEFMTFARQHGCACLIVDLNMPGVDGLEVQKWANTHLSIPVIFITGRGDVQTSVKAMKSGAVDFLTKPVNEADLMAVVGHALGSYREARQADRDQKELQARFAALTQRERQVLQLLANGLLNKQAAGELGISEYTVQIHRAHIMRKMHAASFAELVRQAARLKLDL